MSRLISIAVAAAVVLALLASSMFVVDQHRYAVVYALGELREVIKEPGLHFKLPPPFQNVVYLDKRLQTLDTSRRRTLPDRREEGPGGRRLRQMAHRRSAPVPGGGRRRQRRARRRARGPGRAGGHERRNRRPQGRRRRVGPARAAGSQPARARRRRQPPAGRRSRRRAPQARRLHAASERRPVRAHEGRPPARGQRNPLDGHRRSRADPRRRRAPAQRDPGRSLRDAETIKGEGDAKATQIYAQSFGKNPEFYRFYRSLEAYRATFKGRSDVLVLDSNSEFFKYFKGPGNGK
jgi:membrane protease subunit HflC